MKIAINQPYFFPYIGYFQLIAAVDTFVFYGHVQYTKRSWITKNSIMGTSDTEQRVINIPVHNSSSSGLIKDVLIDDFDAWRRYFMRKIKHSYSKAKHFEETYAFLQETLSSFDASGSIHDFNSYTTAAICQYVGLKTKLVRSNSYFDNIEAELKWMNEKSLVNQRRIQRIKKICDYYGAKEYVNLPNGKRIYDKNTFFEHGLDLDFLELSSVYYNQFGLRDFTPNLSIIDVLMHSGREATLEMINSFQLEFKNVIQCT